MSETPPPKPPATPVPLQRFDRVEFVDAPAIPPARLMTITDGPPAARLLPDAVVTRLSFDRPQWRATPGDPVRRTGTVYDATGHPALVHARDRLDQASLMIVRADEPSLSSDRRLAAPRVRGRHIYAGDLKEHFGHFLLESLCRAWSFAARDPGAKLVFHAGRRDAERALLPFMRFLLEPFGIGPGDVLLAARDLRFDELLLPDSQFDVLARADRGFAAPFAQIRDILARQDREETPARVYFTRRFVDAAALAKLDQIQRTAHVRRRALGKLVANEAAVERLFAARGFAVVAPETLPLARQVALAAGARVLAGVTGTALHHALFAADPEARVVSVATRFSPNQVAIEQLKGLAGTHLFCGGPRSPDAPVPIDLDRLAAGLDALGL